MKKLVLTIIFIFCFVFVQAQAQKELDDFVRQNHPDNFGMNTNLGCIPLLNVEKEILELLCKTKEDSLKFLLNRRTYIDIIMFYNPNDSLDDVYLYNLISLQRSNPLIKLSINYINLNSSLKINRIYYDFCKKFHITENINISIDIDSVSMDNKFNISYQNHYNLKDINNIFSNDVYETNNFDDLINKLNYYIFVRNNIQPLLIDEIELYLSLKYHNIIKTKK